MCELENVLEEIVKKVEVTKSDQLIGKNSDEKDKD